MRALMTRALLALLRPVMERVARDAVMAREAELAEEARARRSVDPEVIDELVRRLMERAARRPSSDGATG